MHGCGCGHRHGRRGRGVRGWGRGRRQEIYEETGTRPAWSRRAGGPGYWRSRAVGMPAGWGVESRAGDEVAQLRQEIDVLHQKLDALLDRFAQSGEQEEL